MLFKAFIAIDSRKGEGEVFISTIESNSIEEAVKAAKRIALSKAPDGSPDYYCIHASVHEVVQSANVDVYG